MSVFMEAPVKLTNIPVVFFEEDGAIICHCLPLDISSCGRDLNEARSNIKDAIEGFVESCEGMGTLEEVLNECGFIKSGSDWRSPAVLESDSIDVPLSA
jgi:predicted RNase H-like HicB family nuclease